MRLKGSKDRRLRLEDRPRPHELGAQRPRREDQGLEVPSPARVLQGAIENSREFGAAPEADGGAGDPASSRAAPPARRTL